MILLAGSVAALGLAVFFVIRGVMEQHRALWQRRLNLPGEGEANTLAQMATASQPPSTWAGRMDQAFAGMIQRTGLGMTAEQALGIIALAGVGLAGLLVLWKGQLWLMGLGVSVGMLVPLVIFLFLQARWRRSLQDQVPDGFFLLSRSMRAGLSLEQSLGLVGEEGHQPLAGEFRRCSEQVKLGLPIPTALQLMADRVRLPDLNVFVSLASLHRSTGGNLALLLDRAAAGARDRNQFRGYFRAATALGRITAIFIGAAAPVLLLIYLIWQPDYLAKFTQNSGGLSALGLALVLEVVGCTWLYLLLRNDY